MKFVLTHYRVIVSAASALLTLVWLIGVLVIAYREAYRDEREARYAAREHMHRHP